MKEWCEINPGRIYLSDEDKKWIKCNIRLGEEYYREYSMLPSTKIYLCDKTYIVNTSKSYFDDMHNSFGSNMDFEESILPTLYIRYKFSSTTTITEKKKLKRITNGDKTT